MSEVQDLVLPILQRIQSDIADLKTDMASVKSTLQEHSERFEEIEIYLAYASGLAQ
jgi:hypothetical protein